MKILAVGDLVGESGVKKLKEVLPNIRKEKQIDFVIVNGENSAGGMGITISIFNELKRLNIDCITMGNHTWGKKDIFNIIDNKKLLRPANYPRDVLGNGYGIYQCNGKKIAVINLIGRASMNVLSENPFFLARQKISSTPSIMSNFCVHFLIQLPQLTQGFSAVSGSHPSSTSSFLNTCKS